MKQQALSFDRSRTRNRYDADNLRCARIILRDRVRWYAECAFLVRWAELVIKRLRVADAA